MMSNIRKASLNDVGRLAEIIVYNNRLNYYPIFKDIEYSFAEFTVENVKRMFVKDENFMNNCFVYEDVVIKGFLCVIKSEVKKLYVDSFFQGEGIGTELIGFAISELGANNLWALEKNIKAIRFYERNGFMCSGEQCYEEGTTELLVHMYKL